MAARSSRYSHNEDDAEQPRRGRQSKSGPPIVPILAVLVLIGAAVYIGSRARKAKEAEAAPVVNTSNEPAPFSSVPDEVPPDLAARGNRTGIRADEAILQDAMWVKAQGLATLGYDIAELSKAANTAGQTAEYQKKAGEAHDKFSEAIEITALWEESLVEKHGDGDPVVKGIMRMRTRWFNQMRKLRAQSK